LQFKNPEEIGPIPSCPFGLEKNLVTRQESEARKSGKGANSSIGIFPME